MKKNIQFILKIKHLILLLIILMFVQSCIKDEVIEPFTNYRQDVKPIKIIDETMFVAGELTLNDYSSKVIRTVKLPSKTKYWALWVGVGQESLDRLKKASIDIPKAAQKITTDPFIAFGLEILSSLPLITGSDNIDFWITDYDNSRKFKNNDQFRYYTFVEGNQTVSKHQIIQFGNTPQTNDGNLYFCFKNYRDFRNLDVTLKVWAFVENP